MFLGEFEYKIDDKGRVPIPPIFRRELSDKRLILTQGVEKCINSYTPSEWKKLADSLTTGSVTRSKLRRLSRVVFATAFRLEIDGQGRIALPVTLRQYAGIEDEAIIVGVNTSFELWNRELWEEEKATSQEQAWQIIESLEQH